MAKLVKKVEPPGGGAAELTDVDWEIKPGNVGNGKMYLAGLTGSTTSTSPLRIHHSCYVNAGKLYSDGAVVAVKSDLNTLATQTSVNAKVSAYYSISNPDIALKPGFYYVTGTNNSPWQSSGYTLITSACAAVSPSTGHTVVQIAVYFGHPAKIATRAGSGERGEVDWSPWARYGAMTYEGSTQTLNITF